MQVVWGYKNRKPVLDHIGSAHNAHDLAVLKARAQRLIDSGQTQLELGLDGVGAAGGTGSEHNPVPITAERAGLLLDAIAGSFHHLGLDQATGGDRVFYDLVAARVIHPGSKFDSMETLAEVGVQSVSYATIKRHLPTYATESYRTPITQALARYSGIGPGVLVLYDVTTLYFETEAPDDLRQPGFSKERRLEPQITVGMLTDAAGLPLAIGAFEGNKAETQTMLPMIQRLQDAYQLDTVTIVADAGMLSAANKTAVLNAGLHYILGVKDTRIPQVIAQWRADHPDTDYKDGQIWSTDSYADARSPMASATRTYYQYSHDRARRSLRGIKEQVAKAERAVAGDIPVKRNRYVDLKAPHKKVNYALAEKHTAMAGIKGYETSRTDLTAEQVIGAYRQLFRIEKSFRMAKSDLKARPVYARLEDSIQAHLTIVMCAMAVGHVLEQTSGLSLKRLVRTLKKYRSFTINVAGQTIHAQTPIPTEIKHIIDKLPKMSY
uniref:IS1634 family transposase n=1 Tax=Corynebacterium cystitidis TaxID=35757 RepID=UPI00358DC2DE